MGLMIDVARSALDRANTLKEGFILSRDEEFAASLHEVDREFGEGQAMPEELRAELELDENPNRTSI